MVQMDRKLSDEQLIFISSYQAISGRLYSLVQNLSRSTRNVLFCGWYSYDIEAAMPTVIYSFCPDATLIKDYIDNKHDYRCRVAELVNSDDDTAKRIMNGAFYGLSMHENVIRWDLRNHQSAKALVRILGLDAQRLIEDDWFVSFAQEVRGALTRISDSVKADSQKIDGEWRIVNANNDELRLKRWSRGKVVNHTYCGVERAIMAAPPLPTSNVILIHDGVLIDREIEVPKMYRVGADLELNIRFEKKRL